MEASSRRPAALREAVVHIGLGKAGTTSVQKFLFRNRDRLAQLGLLIPISAGRGRHAALGSYVRTRDELERSIEWQRRGVVSVRDWRRDFRRKLRREVADSALPRALFTDEDLFSSSERAVERMRGLMTELADEVAVVAYLRRQDDHLVSRYQQAVKIGEVVRLDEYAAQSWAWKYDYGHQLERWRLVLEPARMVVRRYEPGRFLGGSLHQDFLDAIGVIANASDFEQVEDKNASMGVEPAEFMRLMNIFRVEHEGVTPYLVDNRQLIRRLRAFAPGGPTLTLPEDALDRFMEQWQVTNRRVARAYFDEEVLFRVPRKTRDTTSLQRFDPDRLDAYFEGLEIPSTHHAAIRRIADREASLVESSPGRVSDRSAG